MMRTEGAGSTMTTDRMTSTLLELELELERLLERTLAVPIGRARTMLR